MGFLRDDSQFHYSSRDWDGTRKKKSTGAGKMGILIIVRFYVDICSSNANVQKTHNIEMG